MSEETQNLPAVCIQGPEDVPQHQSATSCLTWQTIYDWVTAVRQAPRTSHLGDHAGRLLHFAAPFVFHLGQSSGLGPRCEEHLFQIWSSSAALVRDFCIERYLSGLR